MAQRHWTSATWTSPPSPSGHWAHLLLSPPGPGKTWKNVLDTFSSSERKLSHLTPYQAPHHFCSLLFPFAISSFFFFNIFIEACFTDRKNAPPLNVQCNGF